MELALSLGDTPKPFSFVDHHTRSSSQQQKMKDLGFCMALGSATTTGCNSHSPLQVQDHQLKTIIRQKDEEEEEEDDDNDDQKRRTTTTCSSSSSDPPPPPLQLDLLPFSPVLQSPPPPPPPSHHPFPWLSQNLIKEPGPLNKPGKVLVVSSDRDNADEPAAGDQSSPNNSNSGTSSFQMDFSSIFKSSIGGRSFPLSRKRDLELATGGVDLVEITERDQRASSRGGGGISDEDENGLARKKLRLTKEQSAFLEESFKEHSTLNPKQKLALAKQLNLRPRQVEVWFQNRRARTKLKQTEVDCEYLKRCCETLTEENRRLQKELQELRALKSSQPFYMQLPATTLTMCPSCERVATTTTAASPTATATRQHQPAGGGVGRQ